MTLLQKLATLYLLFNPLRALGIMNASKPQVEPVGGMVCAQWSEVQEAMHQKDFTLPKWVAAEEVVEQANQKPVLFDTGLSLQSSFSLMTLDGASLKYSRNADDIYNWVSEHARNNPSYSAENQCGFIVGATFRSATSHSPDTTTRYCSYSDFASGVISKKRNKYNTDVEAGWGALENVRSNLQRNCVTRPGCP